MDFIEAFILVQGDTELAIKLLNEQSEERLTMGMPGGAQVAGLAGLQNYTADPYIQAAQKQALEEMYRNQEQAARQEATEQARARQRMGMDVAYMRSLAQLAGAAVPGLETKPQRQPTQQAVPNKNTEAYSTAPRKIEL